MLVCLKVEYACEGLECVVRVHAYTWKRYADVLLCVHRRTYESLQVTQAWNAVPVMEACAVRPAKLLMVLAYNAKQHSPILTYWLCPDLVVVNCS